MKLKNKFISFILSLFLVLPSVIPVGAVDLAGGIENITRQVTTQAKAVAIIIFGALSLICLIVTFIFTIKAFLSYKRNGDYSVVPAVCAACGTLVCGLFASSAIFGWFGF